MDTLSGGSGNDVLDDGSQDDVLSGGGDKTHCEGKLVQMTWMVGPMTTV
ncbi:MAG: hypothetical protein ABJ360_16525 [Roseobacter sp.]